MRFVVIVVACLVGACSKSDSTKASSGSATAVEPKPGSAGSGAATSVVGTVTLTGALAGAFHWKYELALRCAWIEELNGGSFEVTLIDDQNTFMALDVSLKSGVKTVILTSGKLHDTFTQKDGGVNFTVTNNGKHAILQLDSIVTAGSQSVTVKGTLELTCPAPRY